MIGRTPSSTGGSASVGCGRISKNHFKAIGEYADDLELVGACDNDPARLDQDFIPGDVPRYDLLPDMLKQAEPDIVAVCTPSGMHPRQTIETAEAGVHVMTEKPMATRWKDGLRMVEACDDAGVHLFVVKQNRFNATLQLLRRAIDEGRFGRIYMAGVNVFWTRPQEYYDTDRWRGTWELDGGAFMNQASHYVDLLDWLIGPVASVQAMAGTARDIEVEDSGDERPAEQRSRIGLGDDAAYPRNLEGSLTILGEHETVKIGGVAVNEIQTDSPTNRTTTRVRNANYETTSVYGYGHPRYYRNVIEVGAANGPRPTAAKA